MYQDIQISTEQIEAAFNHEGVLRQKSAFSKNVLGWSPKPIQHKK